MTEPLKLTLYSKDNEQGICTLKVEKTGWLSREFLETDIQCRVFTMKEHPTNHCEPIFFVDVPYRTAGAFPSDRTRRVCLNEIQFSDELYRVTRIGDKQYYLSGAEVWRACGYRTHAEVEQSMLKAAGF